jgi:hypothetical protein
MCRAVNLGTGTGISVLELVKGMEKAIGRPIPYQMSDRRPGDIARCVCVRARAQIVSILFSFSNIKFFEINKQIIYIIKNISLVSTVIQHSLKSSWVGKHPRILMTCALMRGDGRAPTPTAIGFRELRDRERSSTGAKLICVFFRRYEYLVLAERIKANRECV